MFENKMVIKVLVGAACLLGGNVIMNQCFFVSPVDSLLRTPLTTAAQKPVLEKIAWWLTSVAVCLNSACSPPSRLPRLKVAVAVINLTAWSNRLWVEGYFLKSVGKRGSKTDQRKRKLKEREEIYTEEMKEGKYFWISWRCLLSMGWISSKYFLLCCIFLGITG